MVILFYREGLSHGRESLGKWRLVQVNGLLPQRLHKLRAGYIKEEKRESMGKLKLGTSE